jgi:hypothetical protein
MDKILQILEDVENNEGGRNYVNDAMITLDNDWRTKLSNKKIFSRLVNVLEKYFKGIKDYNEYERNRKQRIVKQKQQKQQPEQQMDSEAKFEEELIQANKNVRLRGVALKMKNTRLTEIDELVRNFVDSEKFEDNFQTTFFPQELLEKYTKQISGRTLSEKCSASKNTKGASLNPNQESVYAIAKLRAEDKINTPGLLVKHGTGAGKTLIAVLILLAFWNKRTTDGRLWTVMLVSTIQNQRHDNNIKKLADLCIDYFPNFQGYIELTKGVEGSEQPIFSKQFYDSNKGRVQAIKNHQEFVVYILLNRISKGIYDTFIKDKKTETNEDVKDKITKYIARRTEDNQLGLSFYGMLGYDLAMNTYTFDQFEFKKQTVETQKEYVETQKVVQKRYLPHVNYFFEDRQRKIESKKYVFRLSNVSQNPDGSYTGTFPNNVTLRNIPSEYVRHVGSEGKDTRKTKKIEIYDSMYPELIDTEHSDFSERIIELNNELQEAQTEFENLERQHDRTVEKIKNQTELIRNKENSNSLDKRLKAQKKTLEDEERVLIKQKKQAETNILHKQQEFDTYIETVYGSLIDFFNTLIGFGVFGQVMDTRKFINSLLPLYQTVLINVFNIKFESGHYYLMKKEFDFLKLDDDSSADLSDETAMGLEDLQTGTDEAKQREELEEDLTNEPYIQMNEYRKIQNCVFIFDEIQLLFDVPSSESIFRHKYKQLIHFMKYYRDPETTWLVGLTATPGSTTKDVADLMSMITTIPDVVDHKDPSKIEEEFHQETRSVANNRFTFTRPGVYDGQMYIADVGDNVVLRRDNPFPYNTDELARYIEDNCKRLISYVDFTSDYSSYPRVSFRKVCVPFDITEEEHEEQEERQQQQNEQRSVDNIVFDVIEDRGEGKRKRRIRLMDDDVQRTNNNATKSESPKSSEAFEEGVDSYVEIMKKYEIERKILKRLFQYETGNGDQKQARNMFIQMNGFYGIAEYLHTFADGNKSLEYYPYNNQNEVIGLPVISKANEKKGETLEFHKTIKVAKKEIYTTLVRAGLYLNIPKNFNTSSFGNKVNILPFTFNSREKTDVKKIMIPSNKTKTVVNNLLNALFDKNGNFKSNTGKHYVYCSDTIGLNLIAYLLMRYSNGKLFPFGTDVSSSTTNHFGTTPKGSNKNEHKTTPASNKSQNRDRTAPKGSNKSEHRETTNKSQNRDRTTPKETDESNEVYTSIEPNAGCRYFFVLDSKSTTRVPVSEAYVALPSDKHKEGKAIAGSKIKSARTKEIVNLHGEIIPIILATGESYKGVDMSAITHIHVVDAFLDFQNFLQLVGRGPRMCSHALLPASQRHVEIIMYHNESTKIGCETTLRNSDVCNGGFEMSSDYLLWNRSIHDYQEIWGQLNKAFEHVAIDRKVFEPTFHKDTNRQLQTILSLTCNHQQQREQQEQPKKKNENDVVQNKIEELQKFIKKLKSTFVYLHKLYDFNETMFKIRKIGRSYNILVKIPAHKDNTHVQQIVFGYSGGDLKSNEKMSILKDYENIVKTKLASKPIDPEKLKNLKMKIEELKNSYETIKNLMKTPSDEIKLLLEQQEFGRRKRLRRR